MSTRSRLRRARPRLVWPCGAALLFAIACRDVQAPPALSGTVPSGNVTTLVSAPTTGAEIEDALERALPALPDDPDVTGLRVALGALLEAMSTNESNDVAKALDNAERMVEVYARAIGPESGAAADLDGIALALTSVSAALAK